MKGSKVRTNVEASGEKALGLLLAMLRQIGVHAGAAVDGNSPLGHEGWMDIEKRREEIVKQWRGEEGRFIEELVGAGGREREW